MILINRTLIFEGSVQNDIRYLLNLKLNLSEALSLIKILTRVETFFCNLKCLVSVQANVYGGSVLKEYPYYFFDGDDQGFVVGLNNNVLQFTDTINDLNESDVNLDPDDFDNVPTDVFDNLDGIVNILSGSPS